MLATVKAVGRSTIPRPPRKSPITLTPAATNQLVRLAQLRQSKFADQSTNNTPRSTPVTSNSTSLKDYIKVAVRTKGCSGNAYTLDWVGAKAKLDEEVTISDSLSVLIDSKALFTLLGSQMDYEEDKLSAGFVFRNPNVKETCGCGLSFIV